MSNLYDKWKESVITVYDSQEHSTLELLEDITSFNDEIVKGIDNLDLKIDTEINNVNLQKTDNLGDHKGSWQGLNRPTLSEEGMRSTVEEMKPKIDKIINEDIVSINSQLEQNKQQVDVLIPKVNSLANGSPKATFATLSALQSDINANTTEGKKNVYVVTADGGWYYWNGSVWTKGGTYQSTGIEDRSIAGRKINFLEFNSINLFDKKTVFENSYIDGNNGTIKSSALYLASDYIEIEPNTEYIASSNYTKAFYDYNKSFISSVDSNIIMTPNNAKYIRLTIGKAENESYMLVKGKNLPESYVSHEYYKINNTITVPGENIENLNVDIDNCTFLNRKSKNLFNKNNAIVGMYIRDTDGTLQPSSYFLASDFIEIEPNTVYIKNSKIWGVSASWYDNSKSFISSTASPNLDVILSPTNAKYIRLNVVTDEVDTFMFTKGSIWYDEYIPYNNYFLPSEISLIENTQWNGKTLGTIGDSITEYPVIFKSASITYVDIINDLMDFGNIKKIAKGGQRFCDLKNIMEYANITENDIKSCDLITIFLGTNDAVQNTPIGNINDNPQLNNSSLYGSIKGVIEYLYSLKPTINLAFIIPMQIVQDEVQSLNMNNIAKAIREVCDLYSLPYLDLYSKGGINKYTRELYYNDVGVHPNYEGHRYLGKKIVKFLKDIVI